MAKQDSGIPLEARRWGTADEVVLQRLRLLWSMESATALEHRTRLWPCLGGGGESGKHSETHGGVDAIGWS